MPTSAPTVQTRISKGITFSFTGSGFAYVGRTQDIDPDGEKVDVLESACQEDTPDSNGVITKKKISSGVRDAGGVKIKAEWDPAIDEIPSGVPGLLVIDYGSAYSANRYWSNAGAILETRGHKGPFAKNLTQDLAFILNGPWSKGMTAPS